MICLCKYTSASCIVSVGAYFYTKMGKKSDLTSSEKDAIVQMLADGTNTMEIARQLSRDHRTIKSFTKYSRKTRTNGRTGITKIWKRDGCQLTKIMKKQPLLTSKTIFVEAGIPNILRDTRCRMLRAIGKVRKPITRPPITKVHKTKRVEWARKYMKLDFRRVIFTDECRATLDGPDGFRRGWIATNTQIPQSLRRQQGG